LEVELQLYFPGEAKRNKKKILCIGDSNTYGYDPRSYIGSRYPEGVRWTSRLEGHEVINCGLNGMTVPRNHARAIGLIRSNEPDLVVVMLGTNDLTGGLSAEQISEFVINNRFDPSNLRWTQNEDGDYLLKIPEDQLGLIHDLDLNVFYNDGEGYFNMGLDNIYDFDADGNLIADSSGAWIGINGRAVPYYHIDTVDDGENRIITGKVPAILNGETAIDLIVVFENDEPGRIAGAYYVYDNDDEPMSAKNLTELNDGDTLDFYSDYYDNEGNYIDTYYSGEQMVIDGDPEISDVYLPEGDVIIMYRITDIYGQEYWTDFIRK